MDVLDGDVGPSPVEGESHGGEVVGNPGCGGIRGVADFGGSNVGERGAQSLNVRGRHPLCS